LNLRAPEIANRSVSLDDLLPVSEANRSKQVLQGVFEFGHSVGVHYATAQPVIPLEEQSSILPKPGTPNLPHCSQTRILSALGDAFRSDVALSQQERKAKLSEHKTRYINRISGLGRDRARANETRR
jgi:hypothetical protein